MRALLQKQLDDRTDVWAAMNYGYPNITEVMKAMQGKGCQQVTVVPLFPHYAVSTTGNVEARVMKLIADWPVRPELTIIRQFYHDPLFLDAWVSRIKAYHPEKYHHIVFSFHGLPLNHLPERCRRHYRSRNVCECLQQSETLDTHSLPTHCYGVACYDMANQLAVRLGLENGMYTVAIQSKMSGYWLRPFTGQILKALASKNMKVLVVAPSFVADCLETSVELGIECRDPFIENSGSEFALVESLNDQPEWIEALKKISGGNIR